MNKALSITISAILLVLVAFVVVYFSVPQFKNWVNGLFVPSTEQPDTPIDSTKPDAPTDITYEVTDSTITITPIENAEYWLVDTNTAWQDNNIFTDLQPATTYTIYVRIKATGTTPASDSIRIEITTDKALQEPPTLEDISYSSTSYRITIAHIAGAEYSIDNGLNWQDGNSFYDLTMDTDYTILIRYKETATHYASESVSVIIRTTKQERNQTPIMSISSVTSTKIIVSSSTLYDTEYSIDNGNTWQDSPIFNNLLPGTSYTIMCRYKETDEYEPSAAVQVSTSTLDAVNAGLFDNEGTLVYSWQQLIDNDAIIVTDGVLDGGARTDRLNGNLVIDSSVSSIADWAFSSTELTSVTIPAGVTSIGDYAFYLSTNLDIVVFDENSQLTTIGEHTFDSTLVSDITLPDSVTTIGALAFQGASLENLYIPDNLTSIGQAFASMLIGAISVSQDNENFQVINGVLFNKAGTELLLYPNADARTSYTIPSGVEIIHNYAFRSTENLTSVTIPEGVVTIGNFAFYSSQITSITLPSNLISLGENALSNCYALTAINVANGNTNFMSVDGVLYSENGTKLLQYPAGKTDTSLVIPEGVISIEDDSLSYLTNLNTITIPSTLTNLGTRPYFRGCSNLIAINVAEGNTIFKSVNGVLFSADETICYYYPIEKTDSTWIVPDTTTQLLNVGFEIATNLESIVFESTTPPMVESNYVLFQDKTLTFYVPDEAVETYKSADWFNDYTNRIKPVSELQG